jgi:hypothetical protein
MTGNQKKSTCGNAGPASGLLLAAAAAAAAAVTFKLKYHHNRGSNKQ